ncbi:MAG: hypothetical protein JXR42_03600 [Gammaproteobacteria bacterium]|nr:hypothetical protein [Gammaproteobacteria bacterium]
MERRDSDNKKNKNPAQEMLLEILHSEKYTETELAKYMDISRETLRLIKIGKTKDPHCITIRKMLTVYHLLQNIAD